MSRGNRLRLAFYGDDFTGSTDALEGLAAAGISAALFLRLPDAALLARFPGIEAIGLAGTSRSKPPAWMDRELPAIFGWLRDTGAPLVHYKVCSTFDSAPETGSIGRAIDLAQQVFGNPWTPLLVGAPALRRYTLFGNHFAGAGAEVVRLDRHPTMARHPVTPMDEADLRRHLARQTARPVALLDILALRGGDPEGALDRLLQAQPGIVLLDVLDEDSLLTVGRLLATRTAAPHFIAGSSGVEHALVAWWRAAGVLAEAPSTARPGRVDRLLVASGSCSPATADQIERARQAGFDLLRADAVRLVVPTLAAAEEDRVARAAEAALAGGRSVVIHTAAGPADPAIAGARAAAAATPAGAAGADEAIGDGLGRIAAAVLRGTPLPRLCIAGGDTSGRCAEALGLEAVTLAAPVAPGAPLCRAVAGKGSRLDGIEVAFKGGQVGGPDFFVALRDGPA